MIYVSMILGRWVLMKWWHSAACQEKHIRCLSFGVYLLIFKLNINMWLEHVLTITNCVFAWHTNEASFAPRRMVVSKFGSVLWLVTWAGMGNVILFVINAQMAYRLLFVCSASRCFLFSFLLSNDFMSECWMTTWWLKYYELCTISK